MMQEFEPMAQRVLILVEEWELKHMWLSNEVITPL